MHEYERMTINNFKMLPYERGTAAKARKANPKLKMLEMLYTILLTNERSTSVKRAKLTPFPTPNP